MEREGTLYKSDNSVGKVSPAGAKFTEEELEHAVGGAFMLIPSNDNEQLFVVSRENKTNSDILQYNINANYFYRRYVDKGKVLKGDVLLCSRDLLELTHIIFFSGSIEKTE